MNLKLLSKKHEVITIIVRDRFEENTAQLGNVNFTDPSSSQTFEGNINSSLVNQYIKDVQHNDHLLYDNLKKSGIEFIKIYTD